MKSILAAITYFLLFSTPIAKAAILGWGAVSGSEVIQDMHNPWFLKNTKTVRYCISVDQKNISIPAPAIAIPTLVRYAFEFWKEDFKFALDEFKTGVATQDFVYSGECVDNKADISFYIGFLPKDLKDKLPDLDNTLGATFRTEYDRKTLRGKGFIYVAPDIGPDALSVHNSDLIDRAWTLNKVIPAPGLFQKLIIHELGHVFGIQHTDFNAAFFDFNIMHAQFIEKILNKDFDNKLRLVFAVPFIKEPIPFTMFPFFSVNQYLTTSYEIYDKYKAGDTPHGVRKFFNLPLDETQAFKIDIGLKYIRVEAFDKDSQNSSLQLSASLQNREESNPEFVVMIKILDKNQTVFAPDVVSSGYIPGPMMRIYNSRAVLENPSTGTKHHVGVIFRNSSIQFSGVDENGTIVPDIFGMTMFSDNLKKQKFDSLIKNNIPLIFVKSKLIDFK